MGGDGSSVGNVDQKSLESTVGEGGILSWGSWGMMGDQRGMVINVFKKVGWRGRHFELGKDGISLGNGDHVL